MNKLFIVIALFVFAQGSFAQSVAINTDGSSANSTAMLDVKSTTKGILPPRMTQVQRDAITTPAEGLIVHCTDCSTVGPYTYNGSTWVSMSYKTYKIGDAVQGGIVFWVDDTGQHGLIAATADQGNNIPWNTGSSFFCSKVRNDGIKIGRINTDAIIAQHGTPGTYAAHLCAQYLGGGYGDWYLPSKYELHLLNLQEAVVGGFGGSLYWSSTENDASNAWAEIIPGVGQGINNKGSNFKVRAIRRF